MYTESQIDLAGYRRQQNNLKIQEKLWRIGYLGKI